MDVGDPEVKRAIVQHQLGQGDAALRTLDALSERSPDDAGLWHLRGRFLDEQGRPEAAVSAFERALELAPDHRDARTNRAWLLGQLRPADGVQAWREVVGRFPRDAAAWANLGALHEQLGAHGPARHAYESALALDPTLDEVREAIRRL